MSEEFNISIPTKGGEIIIPPRELPKETKIDLRQKLPSLSSKLEPAIFDAIDKTLIEKENLTEKLTTVAFSRSKLVSDLREITQLKNNKDEQIIQLEKVADKFETLKVSNSNLVTLNRNLLEINKNLESENSLLKKQIARYIKNGVIPTEGTGDERTQEVPVIEKGR
jgi:hypothetical protein